MTNTWYSVVLIFVFNLPRLFLILFRYFIDMSRAFILFVIYTTACDFVKCLSVSDIECGFSDSVVFFSIQLWKNCDLHTSC